MVWGVNFWSSKMFSPSTNDYFFSSKEKLKMFLFSWIRRKKIGVLEINFLLISIYIAFSFQVVALNNFPTHTLFHSRYLTLFIFITLSFPLIHSPSFCSCLYFYLSTFLPLLLSLSCSLISFLLYPPFSLSLSLSFFFSLFYWI